MTQKEKMRRLECARESLETLTRRKERLSGEIDAKQKRVAELERKAKERFGCEIDEIPDLIEKMDKDASDAIAKAERMLRAGKSEPEEQSDDQDAIP